MAPLLNIDYQFTSRDAPEKRRIEVRIVSTSERQLCVGRDTWPKSGFLATSSGTSNGVYVFVEKRIYAYESTDHWGYCPNLSCYNPLRKGEALEGYLAYERFGLPESDYALPKDLKYKPQPFWCDQGTFLPD